MYRLPREGIFSKTLLAVFSRKRLEIRVATVATVAELYTHAHILL